MGKEYKVLDQEGQKELLDSLQGIFNEFTNKETQGVISVRQKTSFSGDRRLLFYLTRESNGS